MVKEILGANAAGLYAVSISLSEVWYFIPNIIAASFFPAILHYKSKEQKIWSNVFFFFTTISSKWLIAEGLYMHSFYRNILGAILNIVLNFILINKFGLTGAAISTLISYAFVGLFYDLLFKELRINFKMKLKSILLKI